jgi:hypothetical protein
MLLALVLPHNLRLALTQRRLKADVESPRCTLPQSAQQMLRSNGVCMQSLQHR